MKKMRQLIQLRRYFYGLSIVLVGASMVVLSTWGLRLGLDFRGGTLLEVSWHAEMVPDRAAIEESLRSVDRIESVVVQPSGENGTLIRYANSDEALNESVIEKLKTLDSSVELVRTDFIGGSVSDQIRKNAILSVALAVIGIALFIAWAFRKVSRPVSSWQYGVQAVVALAHDILITLGAFSALGHFADVEVGAPFIAALLTILGYSVNDTIVVYDRIRENLLRSGGKEPFEATVNRSLNETIARSFNTSLTVIIVLLAIVVWGGSSIQSFSLALLIGVAAGTYSSIYVASALLVTSNLFREKRLHRMELLSTSPTLSKSRKKQEGKREKESIVENRVSDAEITEISQTLPTSTPRKQKPPRTSPRRQSRRSRKNRKR